jgi:hypothetical protein
LPANFTTTRRPVAPRATRTADIVASVPDDTSRTISTDGTRSQMASARRTSRSVGAPYEVPATAAFCTASTMAGWAWPAMIAPYDCTRSR